MFLKRTIRKDGTITTAEFKVKIINTIKEMLNECGIKDIVEYDSGESSNYFENNYLPGFPNSSGKCYQYRASTVNPSGQYMFMSYYIGFSCDDINYVIGFYYYPRNNEGSFATVVQFTDLCKGDYYNNKENRDGNFLGARSGGSTTKIFEANTRIFFTLCRNESTKTFAFIVDHDKLSSQQVVACHSGVVNYGPNSNEGCVCLPHMNGTMSSRKDYGVTEEHFRMINPISFYGSEAFDYVDNIDKINNKAYIQKPLVAMYKRGIVAEIKGLYYSTIKAPKIGDVVSMGGITYIYIGAGLYFKNEV